MGMLSNRVALITGGARGIGAAIAKRQSEEGSAVSITYAVSKEAAEELVRSLEKDGRGVLAIQGVSEAPRGPTRTLRHCDLTRVGRRSSVAIKLTLMSGRRGRPLVLGSRCIPLRRHYRRSRDWGR
jgi:NAD(P)-dependent dehydrogenase (short-subunit alcohol dehydrogenase family)